MQTRYMMSTRDEGIWIPNGGTYENLEVCTDTDWAGCKRTRMSTTCVVAQCGDSTLFSAVHGQEIHAQSSGEAEFYGVVSGTGPGLLLKHALGFLGIAVKLKMRTDSSAARGTLARQGVGKLRHIEVKTLWVQDLVARKVLAVLPIDGIKNPADVGTKVHNGERLN